MARRSNAGSAASIVGCGSCPLYPAVMDASPRKPARLAPPRRRAAEITMSRASRVRRLASSRDVRWRHLAGATLLAISRVRGLARDCAQVRPRRGLPGVRDPAAQFVSLRPLPRSPGAAHGPGLRDCHGALAREPSPGLRRPLSGGALPRRRGARGAGAAEGPQRVFADWFDGRRSSQTRANRLSEATGLDPAQAEVHILAA